MSEQTPLKHSESPWLWVMLSGGSIALHAGLLLALNSHALQFQPTSVTASGNWVPITLWSATAAPTPAAAPQKATPSVPIAPQNTPKATSTPQSQPPPTPQATPKPALKPSPTPTPSPTPRPNATPNPPQNEAVVDENESHQQNQQPDENNSSNSNNGSNQTGPTNDADSASSPSFSVAPLGFTNLCLSGNPDCKHPVDSSARTIQEPTSGEIGSLLKELALKLTETVKIQTVIDVKLDGTAEVIVLNPSLTQVLDGNIERLEAEALAAKLIKFYRFETPRLQGVPKRHDYTVILTIAPNS
ncbi:MAG: hypothetical protein F6J87_00085 [Spirulina sp. SIO3F2]|nr:hypothetical protein [Spirulina sp. SIO3F2]